MNKEQKKDLTKIIIALLLFILAELISHFPDFAAFAPLTGLEYGGYVPVALFLISYAIVGFEPVSNAVRNILRGQVFDENFLMSVATIGALALKQWDEAVAVMLFYSVGELFEDIAVDRSRKSITELMDIRPDYANLVTEEGEQTVDPYDIEPGDIILVKPGEKVPLDGLVVDGSSTLDTSALTGESMPRPIEEGMDITSGFINLTGVIKIKVTSTFDESTVSKVLDLVENSGSKKAQVEKFITKFARYYTPAVVFSAIALAIIPPLFFSQPWGEWIYRALLFLVISCPCALVISVPLAYFGGVGAASKTGVLVKGSNYLEALSSIETAIFDKTGTLTTGTFKVTEIQNDSGGEYSDEEILKIAAHAEAYSTHPISVSIRQEWNGDIDENIITDLREISGKGIAAGIDGKQCYVGNARLMEEFGLSADTNPAAGDTASAPGSSESPDNSSTIIHIACEDRYLGRIMLSDVVKEDAAIALSRLKEMGVKKNIMLTGDLEAIAKKVAGQLGIDEYHSQLMPQDKVTAAEKIIDESSGNVVFVGDGINDAPTLARADVGIAMGGAGSQAAIEAADIVIMDDSPSKIASVMNIARRTQKIAKQNVIFALAVKAAVLILGAVGIANMWMAVFADVGVAILAILNSMRMLMKRTY